MNVLSKLQTWIGIGPIFLILLLFIPLAVFFELSESGAVLVFFTSALAVIPVAGMIGQATESLAEHVGERLGGLLNATFGNAAELIIAIVALSQGKIVLVLASITGSILGNLLLVLGLAILLGGFKNGTQKFNRSNASIDATLLILAVIALGIPSFFNWSLEPDFFAVEGLSIGASIAMLVVYVMSIVYSLTARSSEVDPTAREAHGPTGWSVAHAIVVLVVAIALVAYLSELLVSSVEPVTESLGLSEFFVGIIIIPLVGNVAEHFAAVTVAIKNKMDLSLSIAIGSSLQIALFVAPLLVFISLFMGNPMALEFNSFEVVAMLAASFIASLVSLDGESNWLEGAMLLTVYVILALAFFFV